MDWLGEWEALGLTLALPKDKKHLSVLSNPPQVLALTSLPGCRHGYQAILLKRRVRYKKAKRFKII